MKKRRKRRSPLIPLLALALLAVLFIAVYPRIAARQQYPVRYEAEIREAAQVYSLDPALLAAVARIESSYRPDARSYAGALGLMQIMPETGAWIAEKRGERDAFTDDRLLDPETSLLYGGWYMRYLLDEFGGDFTCAVAAYHAGQGTVRKWLKNPAYSSDGLTLSAFPTDAPKTGHYVSKVRKAYDYYLKKYR